MQPLDPSRKHFYVSIVKSIVRLAACFALFNAGMQSIDGFNPGSLIVVSAFLFAAAEGLGIVEEL